jgi:hypothetical protein
LIIPLPRRRSAAPLSSTIDKHERVTDPVEHASRWAAMEGEQAILIVVRTREAIWQGRIPGDLVLHLPHGERRRIDERGITLANDVSPGTWFLGYHDREGAVLTMAVPVVRGWDTQIFIMFEGNCLQLDRATILMRKAGLDAKDALLDAYERALADLASGGPGPDKQTLDKLLWGKYQNLVRPHRRSLPASPPCQTAGQRQLA